MPDAPVKLPSCGERAEVPQSHQIVDRHGEGKHPADAVAAAMLRLAQQADRLKPAEHFLDPLAEPLAHRVAGVARGARVKGGTLLLRHVWRDVERAEAVDEVPLIVMLVRAERGPAPAGDLLRHRPGGLPFRAPRGL